MSFKAFENLTIKDSVDLEIILDEMITNSDGLIPAIAQDKDSKQVLMMAWMNRKSLEETLSTGQVCYWSRSRKTYWRKGESSGHQQLLESMAFDCDGDAILMQVSQKGPACHTNRRSCFYLEVKDNQVIINSEKM